MTAEPYTHFKYFHNQDLIRCQIYFVTLQPDFEKTNTTTCP